MLDWDIEPRPLMAMFNFDGDDDEDTSEDDFVSLERATAIRDDLIAQIQPNYTASPWQPSYHGIARDQRVTMRRVVNNTIANMSLLDGKAYDMDSPIFAGGETGREILARTDINAMEFVAMSAQIRSNTRE